MCFHHSVLGKFHFFIRIAIVLRSKTKRWRGLRERPRERVLVRGGAWGQTAESQSTTCWTSGMSPRCLTNLIEIPVAWWPAGHWVLGLLLWNRAHFSLSHYSTLQQLLKLKTNWPSVLQRPERWSWGHSLAHSIVHAYTALDYLYLYSPCDYDCIFILKRLACSEEPTDNHLQRRSSTEIFELF